MMPTLLPLSKHQFIEIHTNSSVGQVLKNIVESITLYINEVREEKGSSLKMPE
jgi:hypothetical protein